MRNRLMIKEFTLTLLVFIGAGLALVYPHSAAAIGLKSSGVISDNSIMLSDIFSGLPAHKDKVLGPAPQPGKDMVLNARTLMRIAIALDLPWRPVDAGEHIVLSRAATIVDFQMIEDVLKTEMAGKGIGDNYQIAFNGPFSEIVLPMDEAPSVEVKSINIRENQGRFEATLVAPSKRHPLKTMRVSGTVQRVIQVPVLRESMRQGMVIGKRDIEYVAMRERDLGHSTILHEGELVGMTPRRVALQGKPLKLQDLEAPQIVERGDFVTMVFAHKGMTLTAKGKALENGAKGELIRVSNLSTSKTLQAEVVAQREVKVSSY